MANKYQVMNVDARCIPPEVVGGFDTKEAAHDYAHQISSMHPGVYSVRVNPNFMDDLIAENTVALAMRDAARRLNRSLS